MTENIYMLVDKFVDSYQYHCYYNSNIPTRPLPQGRLNYGGFFYFQGG